MKKCINCNEKVDSRFCGNCGQSQIIAPLQSRNFLKDLWDTIALVNSPLKITFLSLLKCPGQFVINYGKGQRIGFLSPVSFFLMVLALYVIVAPLTIDSSISTDLVGVKEIAEQEQTTELQQTKSLIKNHLGDLKDFVKQGVNFFYFIFPFALYLFLPKKPFDENKGLVFYASFYYVGITLVIAIPFLLLAIIHPMFMLGRILMTVTYLVFAFNRFYGLIEKRSLMSILSRVLMAYLTYMAFVASIVAGWFVIKFVFDWGV